MRKDTRQWICKKCRYINDWSSLQCVSCGKHIEETCLRTNSEKVLIAYDSDGNRVELGLSYHMEGCATVVELKHSLKE